MANEETGANSGVLTIPPAICRRNLVNNFQFQISSTFLWRFKVRTYLRIRKIQTEIETEGRRICKWRDGSKRLWMEQCKWDDLMAGASFFSAAVSAGLIGLLALELDIQIGSEYIRGVSKGIKIRRAPSNKQKSAEMNEEGRAVTWTLSAFSPGDANLHTCAFRSMFGNY